jgi:hypothetical protein
MVSDSDVIWSKALEFFTAPDLKEFLKSNPSLVNDLYHKAFSIFLTGAFKPTTDGARERLRDGAVRLQMLRRSIDVGVDLAFAGF